jgi:hypothetical protein
VSKLVLESSFRSSLCFPAIVTLCPGVTACASFRD